MKKHIPLIATIIVLLSRFAKGHGRSDVTPLECVNPQAGLKTEPGGRAAILTANAT